MQHHLQLVNEHGVYTSEPQQGAGSYHTVLHVSSAVPSSRGFAGQGISLELAPGLSVSSTGHNTYVNSTAMHVVRTSPTSCTGSVGQLPAWQVTQSAVPIYTEAVEHETMLQYKGNHTVHMPGAVLHNLSEAQHQAMPYTTIAGASIDWVQGQQAFHTQQVN